MNLEEAYTGCRNAIEFFKGVEEKVPFWEFVRSTGESPSEAIKRMKNVAIHTLSICPTWILSKALPEMDHPDFLKYVRAKLGAM